MPAAAAGAGVLISAYSAVSASNAQKRAMDLQKSSLMADQAFRQQQLDEYKKNFGPLEEKLLQQASSEQPLNLGPTWARIQSNFDQAGRNSEASLARKGMLGSGLDTHSNLESARAFTLSDAFSKGIQGRDALRREAISLGRNLPQQAGFLSQGNQQMAGLYGQQAGLYGGLAAGAGQGLSSSLGALGYALGYQPPPPTPQPTVDTSITSMPTDAMSPIGTRTTWDPGIPLAPLSPVYSPGGGAFPPSPGYSAFSNTPITGPADR